MMQSSATATQISHYISGYCDQLASALWDVVDQCDWTLAIITTDDGESGHLVLREQDGTYIDIRGRHTAEELSALYPDAELRDTTEDWLYERGWQIGHYTTADVTAAQQLCDDLHITIDDDAWENARENANAA